MRNTDAWLNSLRARFQRIRTDALETVLEEVRQGQIPPTDCPSFDLDPLMPPSELRRRMLQCTRAAIGDYAVAFRSSATPPRSPQQMVEYLIGSMPDQRRARPIAEAIVQRVGELVMDDAFRRAMLWRTVQESQEREDFKDRIFACEPREGAGEHGDTILMPGRHLGPDDLLLRGQNAEGGPSWLRLSQRTATFEGVG